MRGRSRGWRGWVGFLLGIYLAWVIVLSMISWSNGLGFAVLIYLPELGQAFITWAKLLWLPVLVGFAAALVIGGLALRLLRLGFVVAIIANVTFFAALVGVAEVYARWSMDAQAAAQRALCFERNSFVGSLADLETGPLLGEHRTWRSHGRAILPQGRALWSYRTMRFELIDKDWQARLPCEEEWMRTRGS